MQRDFLFLLRKGDHQMKCSCDVIRGFGTRYTYRFCWREENCCFIMRKKKSLSCYGYMYSHYSHTNREVLVKYLNIYIFFIEKKTLLCILNI
jgi:hypothetical protein